MDVAIAGMKNIGNAEPVFFAVARMKRMISGTLSVGRRRPELENLD